MEKNNHSHFNLGFFISFVVIIPSENKLFFL